ncbi:MAG: hypothetical protein ACE5G1_11560 [bacterium]
MEDYSPQDLKKWIRELFDPDTPKEDLERNAMTLAHIRQPEALRALEEFKKSSRGKEVGWIDCAIEECIFGLLSPENEREEKDYMRVELWQRYEDELFEMQGKLEAAETRKQQLEVEKEFLEGIVETAPEGQPKLTVLGTLSGIDNLILLEENNIMNLKLEIEGQEYLVEQIEEAIESPFYRKYGKGEIGVHMYRTSDGWEYDEDDDELPF